MKSINICQDMNMNWLWIVPTPVFNHTHTFLASPMFPCTPTFLASPWILSKCSNHLEHINPVWSRPNSISCSLLNTFFPSKEAQRTHQGLQMMSRFLPSITWFHFSEHWNWTEVQERKGSDITAAVIDFPLLTGFSLNSWKKKNIKIGPGMQLSDAICAWQVQSLEFNPRHTHTNPPTQMSTKIFFSLGSEQSLNSSYSS